MDRKLMPDSVLAMVEGVRFTATAALELSQPWEQTLHITEFREKFVQILKELSVYATNVPTTVPLIQTQRAGVPVGDGIGGPHNPGA